MPEIIFSLLLSLSFLAVTAPVGASEVPVEVWPSESSWQRAAPNAQVIINVVRDHFDLSLYHRAAVKVQFIDGQPRSLLVFLLSKDTHSSTIHRREIVLREIERLAREEAW